MHTTGRSYGNTLPSHNEELHFDNKIAMSISPHEAEMEDAYDRLAEELYGEHKERAIEEFTNDRLKSYYAANPWVMRPAVDALQEGKRLLANGHHSAALVFFVSAIEILLKATLLRPVLYGLIHNDSIAEMFVEHTLSQTGFDRYEKLLAKLYRTLVGNDLSEAAREGSIANLLTECREFQRVRNGIIHRGETCSAEQADASRLVAVLVFGKIVRPVLYSIGLDVIEKGQIVAA